MAIYFKTGADEGDLAYFHSPEVSSAQGVKPEPETVGFGVLATKFRGQPAQLDGVSVLMEVHEKEPEKVSGFMRFPERAHFEFEGSFQKMLSEIKTLRGQREIFDSQNFTFQRV